MAKKGTKQKRGKKRGRKVARKRRVQRNISFVTPSGDIAAFQGEVFSPDAFSVDERVSSAPLTIAPTVYPESPHGTIIVQNHIMINISTDEFRHFNTEIELLIRELRYSNEISGEVRDQLLSELKAGREIITGPKPQRDLVDLLLVRPLKWLAEKSGSAFVSKLAADALTWLLKIIV